MSGVPGKMQVRSGLRSGGPRDLQRDIIEDDDMEDSQTDTAELWMSDRNDEDTKFVRAKGDAIPTKKYP